MANPYALFMNLLPKDTKVIAKVVSVDPNGSVVVSIPGSTSNITVKGDGSDTYAPDDHVFIVNGVIVAKTPTLQAVSSYAVI